MSRKEDEYDDVVKSMSNHWRLDLLEAKVKNLEKMIESHCGNCGPQSRAFKTVHVSFKDGKPDREIPIE
jgi:hypothetical protein